MLSGCKRALRKTIWRRATVCRPLIRKKNPTQNKHTPISLNHTLSAVPKAPQHGLTNRLHLRPSFRLLVVSLLRAAPNSAPRRTRHVVASSMEEWVAAWALVNPWMDLLRCRCAGGIPPLAIDPTPCPCLLHETTQTCTVRGGNRAELHNRIFSNVDLAQQVL